MLVETANAPRTWFVTWTLNPAFQRKMDEMCEARHGTVDQKGRLDICREWHQLAFKRLRRKLDAVARLRFVAVVEWHQSGYPHIHMLVHAPVTSRQFKGSWQHGFEDIRLVSDDASRYLTKYVLKGQDTKVWASKHYGQLSPATDGRKTQSDVGNGTLPSEARKDDPKKNASSFSEADPVMGKRKERVVSAASKGETGVNLGSPLETFLEIEAVYSAAGDGAQPPGAVRAKPRAPRSKGAAKAPRPPAAKQDTASTAPSWEDNPIPFDDADVALEKEPTASAPALAPGPHYVAPAAVGAPGDAHTKGAARKTRR